MLCDIAFVCDLATVDCIMTAEMIHMLAYQLESAAECCELSHCQGEELGSTICPDSVCRTSEIMHYFYLNMCSFMENISGLFS